MPSDEIEPIPCCPKQEPTENERCWYKIPQVEGFNICSRCFHDSLAGTPFAQQFDREYDESLSSRFCDFNYPRVRQTLQQAIGQESVDVLRGYALQAIGVPRCKGGGKTVKPEEGFSWYQLTDPGLKGKFGGCKACYENYIVPAGFAGYFADPIRQPNDQLFECNMSWPFSQRLSENCTDWGHFLALVMHRQQLPRCAGSNQVDHPSRAWYRLRDPELTDLWVCEACYYDVVSMTVAERMFYQSFYAPTAGMKLTCFAGGNVALRVALNEAIKRNESLIFFRAAHAVTRLPPCRKEGTSSTTWYSLVPSCAEFDVCAGCYAGIFESTSMEHSLAPKQVQNSEARVCNMNIGVPGAIDLYKKLDLAIDRRDPGIFTEYARAIVDLPACPRSDVVKGRKWYRHEMFSCCQSCWLQAPIEGTLLASTAFSSKGELYEGSLKCDFYSARVRNLWKEACSKNDLPGFVAIMQQRLEIWKQTYPLIQQQLAMMRMNMERQQTLFMSSTVLQGGNNIAAAAGAHGNYGNSTVGFGYETYSGAQAAVQFNQALSMNAANGGLAGNLAQLTALWESVE